MRRAATAGSTAGDGTGIVVENGNDVRPGKDDAELEGELRGIVGGGQLALAGGGASLPEEEVAPLLLHAGDLVVHATGLGSDLG